MQDTFSLVLFALYKIKSIPEYATLSELIYVLDENSIMKLCEYFGGMTIRIPTLDEFKRTIQALSIYQLVDIEGKPLATCIKQLDRDTAVQKEVRNLYLQIREVMEKYQFVSK